MNKIGEGGDVQLRKEEMRQIRDKNYKSGVARRKFPSLGKDGDLED